MKENVPPSKASGEAPDSLKPFLLLLVATFAIVVIVGTVLIAFIDTWEHRGHFGDMFGVTNTLFSGLAFAALTYALLLQRRDLVLQRNELTLTRTELAKQSEAQATSAASQKLIAILERTAQHNWEIYRDGDCRRAIEIMQKLNVPDDPEERKLYWATRIVHLSHVLLIQQVWVLAGQPKNLTGIYENWQKFAKAVAEDIRNAESTDKPPAYKSACADYWQALHDIEENDPEFVRWLEKWLRKSEQRYKWKLWV